MVADTVGGTPSDSVASNSRVTTLKPLTVLQFAGVAACPVITGEIA